MLPKIRIQLHHALFSFLFICLTLLFVNSCKKADTLVSNKSDNEIAKEKTPENFFNLPANAAPVLRRIANELEKQNKTKEFIKAFIAKEGFPIWDKASIETHKRKIKSNTATGFDGDGLEDTTVYIPLVVNAQQYVHGFLKATVTDTVELKIFRQNDYKDFPFQTSLSSSTVTTAENFSLRMMAMDRDVFGSTEFKLEDKRMFNNSTDYSDTGNIQRFIKFINVSGEGFVSDGTTINNVMYEVCVDAITYTRNNCLNVSGTSNNMCGWTAVNSEVCVSWEEEGGGGGGQQSGGWPFPPPGEDPGGGGGGPGGGGSNPPCGPGGGNNIVNGFVPIECEQGPGGNPWPTRDAHGFLYSRIAELNYQLSLDPAAIEPCDSLNIMPLNPTGFGSLWQSIAQFQIPGPLQNRIDSVNNLFTTSAEQPPLPMYQQTLSAASGGIVNCDFYPVRIIQLPTGYTAQSLVEYFRKNMTYFAQPSCTFDPYSYTNGSFGISFNDSARFNAPYQSSVGALVHIGITLNDGTVIESKYENYNSPPYNHESHQFMFSTLRTPLDFTHPVGGNRAFGIYNSTSQPSQYTFYTMGVDRVWHWLDILLGLQNTVFQGGDELWTNMQDNMIAFINSLPGGQATPFTIPKIIARPKWNQVESYLRGNQSWTQLKAALGC